MRHFFISTVPACHWLSLLSLLRTGNDPKPQGRRTVVEKKHGLDPENGSRAGKNCAVIWRVAPGGGVEQREGLAGFDFSTLFSC